MILDGGESLEKHRGIKESMWLLQSDRPGCWLRPPRLWDSQGLCEPHGLHQQGL